jgi:hypothetical protein
MHEAQEAQPHERRDLYEDDLTDERDPSPVQIEEASHKVQLDPDTDDDDDHDDDDDDDDELDDELDD